MNLFRKKEKKLQEDVNGLKREVDILQERLSKLIDVLVNGGLVETLLINYVRGSLIRKTNLKNDFYLLLEHLGLKIENVTSKRVIRKVRTKPKIEVKKKEKSKR